MFKINKNLIINLILFLIIFLIPSNLFFKFFKNTAYVNGLLIDYLIPKIYLSDIFIFLFIIIYLFLNFKKLKKFNFKKIFSKNKILFFLILLFIFRQFLTAYPIASVYYLLKIILLFLFFKILNNYKKIFYKKNIIIYAITAALLFQSLLAIYQFHAQKSFLNFLFLGETNLLNYANVAKGVFNGVEKILPYGTTAHPNILAGFLVFGMIPLLSPALAGRLGEGGPRRTPWWVRLVILIPATYALYLTQSVSAFISLIFILLFIYNPTSALATSKTRVHGVPPIFIIFLFFTTPLFINLYGRINPQTPASISRRAFLNTAAVNMFLDNKILGVGLNNFTARLEAYTQSREVVRFIQPVHHLGLLFLSEAGVLGVIILLLLIKKYKNKWRVYGQRITLSLAIITPIACLDHYLLTNQTGLLILIFVFTIMAGQKNDHNGSLPA